MTACLMAETDLIPARMLNEVVYCPRLFYLERVAGEWEESADTVSGKRVHRRVDAKASPLPEPAALPDDLRPVQSRSPARPRASSPSST